MSHGWPVKAIVIRGAGGNFCSGGDVHEIIGPLTKMDSRGLLEFTRMTGDLVRAMRGCPQPIIAAVEGVCAGAGAIIAMASDIRFASPNAKTAFLFTRVGLSGADMGACAILPRIIGQGRAAELLFTGRSMSAEEGFAWGFWNRVVVDVWRRPRRLPPNWRRARRIAHGVTKKQLDAEWNVIDREAIEMEARGAGALHGDQRLRAPTKPSRTSESRSSGVTDRLAWPFFDLATARWRSGLKSGASELAGTGRRSRR